MKVRIDSDQLDRIIRKANPDYRLVSFAALEGGVSSSMICIEVRGGRGTSEKLILRIPGDEALSHNPHTCRDEFNLLNLLRKSHVSAPVPHLWDESCQIIAFPYLLIEYIDGAPVFMPADIEEFTRAFASQMASLHRFSVPDQSLDLLGEQSRRLTRMLAKRPASLDQDLQEGAIRAALEERWPLPGGNKPSFLHGDLWPGNVLFRDGELVAVIDWEDAEIGEPLYELAITRLDFFWMFGEAAMELLTEHYLELTGLDVANLPCWDLFAALRPASKLALWASAWPDVGRDDITEDTMRTVHAKFVDRALSELRFCPSR